MLRTSDSDESSQALAICALTFLASNPDLLDRFLSLSGIDGSAIRTAAGEPGFLSGVAKFILDDEPTLIKFATSIGTPPERIAQSFQHLL